MILVAILFGAAALRLLVEKPRHVPTEFLVPPKMSERQWSEETNHGLWREYEWYRDQRRAEFAAIKAQSPEQWQKLRRRAIEKWKSDEQTRVAKEHTAGKWLLVGLAVVLGIQFLSL